jgi:putative transposase
MVSPRGRRRAVEHLRTNKYSERRACRLMGQPRSTQRYCAKEPTDKAKRLRRRILSLARKFPRYGHRRLTAELRREGWIVNRKCIRRVCREEGLKIVIKGRKRRRGGRPGEQRAVAEHKNHVWSYDFLYDRLEDGRQIKILPVVDNYTRECLAILVAFNITANDVVDLLQRLVSAHGAPGFMRSDNGPEFIARAVKGWLEKSGIATDYIEPGSPWENSYSESFNSRFRDELLNCEIFTTLLESRVVIEEHRQHYNDHRVHSSLGYRTPTEFAAQINKDRERKAAAKEKAESEAAARAA